MTNQQVGELLEQQQYVYAKTMPWCPHYYTLKKTWDDGEQYRAVIAWILENGEKRRWSRKEGTKGTTRRYFDHGEWRYWPMTTNPDASILLNRAKIATDTSVPVTSNQKQLKLKA